METDIWHRVAELEKINKELVEACRIGLKKCNALEIQCYPKDSIAYRFWLEDKQKIEQALAKAEKGE